jgi:hypothetical protein
MMSSLTEKTLVPLGSVVLAVSIAVGTVKTMDAKDSAQSVNLAVIQAQVAAIDARVTRAETRQDKTDERWSEIREDLAKIKAKLGIETTAKK